MAKWTVAAKRADFKAISARFGIDQVVARLIRNRDVVGDEEIEKYLHGSVSDFFSPFLMKDLEKAGDIILEKIEEEQRIRVIGDYDIDGVMSTYILMTGLLNLGAFVDYAIPDRIKDGYGINTRLIDDAYRDGIDTIITCDNGIAAREQVEYAKELGMTIIVTDHHNIPFDEDENGKHFLIPDAHAVVDPKQESCQYPYKELCGAAVAWKMVCLLYEMVGIEEDEAFDLLEFVAIATIGDVVPLTGENRIIVKLGLERLRKTRHLGLNALFEKCELSKASVNTRDIGFRIGPCINASGRLATADKAVELMMAETREDAILAAAQLKDLNDSRKSMTEAGFEKAIRIVEEEKKDKLVYVLLVDGIHESLAGIIAGRIKEKYNKPSFVLTKSDGVLKGSGRSIDGYNMFNELTRIKSVFMRFGGHEMAAGITLEEGKLSEFEALINANCPLCEADMEPKVQLDMVLPLAYIKIDLIEEFSLLEPFGTGNDEPNFGEKNLEILSKSLIGKNKNVCKLSVKDQYGTVLDAVCFKKGVELYEYLVYKNSISIAYCPTINDFRGQKCINIVINDWF